jgi:hypothetical protein
LHGSVGRFLKEADLKPHRSRYWLTAKPDLEFDTKCADICAVYQAAPAAAEQNVQTVSIDEMTDTLLRFSARRLLYRLEEVTPPLRRWIRLCYISGSLHPHGDGLR